MADRSLKNELKHPDEFISFFGPIAQWFWTHSKQVLVFLVVMMLLGVGYFGWKMFQLNRAGVAADAFFPIDTELSALAESGDTKSVLSKLDGFILKFGDSSYGPIAQIYRGRILIRDGRLAEAREAFVAAQKGLPSKFTFLAYEGEATTWMEEKKYSQAEPIWKRLSENKNNPLRATHLWNLGLALQAQGKKEQALAAYQTFEKEFPSSPMLEQARSRLNILKPK